MLPQDVAELVESEVGEPVIRHRAVSGGCIANASRIETRSGSYFLKWSRDEVARTFLPEAAGLRALRDAGADLLVPEPLAVKHSKSDGPGILLMEWIEAGRKDNGFWERFGRSLASLHQHTKSRYGFHDDNFIGRLPQANEWKESWPSFFLTQRIEPQVRMAKERRLWKPAWDAPLNRLTRDLSSILPRQPEASVLHGDLWGGNFLMAADGRAAVFDPATYYGHREADIGMTRLFGGFEQSFYEAYMEAWPLDAGYEDRLDLYNLYHLINHLNHFGAGYSGSVEGILRRF